MKLAEKLTPKIVREYHGDLIAHVDCSLLDIRDITTAISGLNETSNSFKSLTELSGIIGKLFELLEKFEIHDPIKFIETTAITLPLSFAGECFVCVPWVPGIDSSFSLASQIEIISHEATHVLRSHRDAHWLTKYLASFGQRCREERHAFQTSLELCKLLYGQIPSIGGIIGNLDRYFLRPTDEDVLIAGLSAIMRPIQDGDVSTPVGKFARQWFNERFPDAN